jgi:hypothetical protein
MENMNGINFDKVSKRRDVSDDDHQRLRYSANASRNTDGAKAEGIPETPLSLV